MTPQLEISAAVSVSCAVEVFLSTALLHREQPSRPDFTIQEIVSRAVRENMTGEMRSGVNVHASQHCVANRQPNPSRHRMLYATGKHTRRLLLPGDDVNPERSGKIFPEPNEIPDRYLTILEWAKSRFKSAETRNMNHPSVSVQPALSGRWLESLFELEGLGKEYWKKVSPDKFVRQLREGWE